ncbi:EAL and HDOD domain-containing protein [uncultured Salinicola sp.]|uniref:EAL and HDOD domain-containing protein n=1 Tax=uncultured Salinicola sp. TaxID=1193542 RepID=UPI00260446D9|nr:HDOD domain-containing protein [uncultured Salinicola sp.]
MNQTHRGQPMQEASEHPAPAVLFARQPIFDASLDIVAFELLFRPTDGGPMPTPFDGNRATSTVLLNAFTQGDLNTVSQGKPLFVNFTAETLSDDLPFDASRLVVELLEDMPFDDAIRDRLELLRQRGFTLALDDYAEADATHPCLPLVDIVKLEYPHYSEEGFDHIVRQLRRHYPKIRILAEKLETEEDLERCQHAGCDLFQGYFLARPQLVHGAAVTTDRLAILKLIATLNKPKVSVGEISSAIGRDPTLGVRLLRLVNTVQYQRQINITSLRQAVALIGTHRIRSLATLLALSEVEDKPESLQQLALSRACLCRELAVGDPDLAEKAFISGLFSYLEAFFNRPLEELVESLPLHASISAALLHHDGPVGTLLETAIRLESGEWNEIPWTRLTSLGIKASDVGEANQRALQSMRELQTNARL